MLSAIEVSDIKDRYENGNPKLVNTYQSNRNQLDLVKQVYFYEDGKTKAEFQYRNSTTVKAIYFKPDGKKSKEPFDLSDSSNNQDSSIHILLR